LQRSNEIMPAKLGNLIPSTAALAPSWPNVMGTVTRSRSRGIYFSNGRRLVLDVQACSPSETDSMLEAMQGIVSIEEDLPVSAGIVQSSSSVVHDGYMALRYD
jgi:hypothetical protein